MEGSVHGTKPGATPADSGEGDSPLAALSGLADRVRGVGDPAGATVSAPPFEERPELYVGAAFAGGLVLAGFIRLLGR